MIMIWYGLDYIQAARASREWKVDNGEGMDFGYFSCAMGIILIGLSIFFFVRAGKAGRTVE